MTVAVGVLPEDAVCQRHFSFVRIPNPAAEQFGDIADDSAIDQFRIAPVAAAVDSASIFARIVAREQAIGICWVAAGVVTRSAKTACAIGQKRER